MKSPLPKNSCFSSFRFSIQALRSPVSPLTPQEVHFGNNHEQSLSICHSASEGSSPTARGTPEPHEKDRSIGVNVVESYDVNEVRTPNALPHLGPSPITPWQSTFRRHAASTEHESTYLRRARSLRFAKALLSFLLLGVATSLFGLEADILARYNRTHLSKAWELNLWPVDVNLKPTLLAVASGASVTLLAVSSVLITFIHGPNPRHTLENSVFSALSIVAMVLGLATIVLSAATTPAALFSTFISSTLTSLVSTTGPANTVGLTPNGHGSNPKRETIQSFTCTIANTAKAFNNDATTLRLPSLADTDRLIPTGFAGICTESRAGLALTVVLLVLAVFGLLVSAATFTLEKRIQRMRGEREVIASRHGSQDQKFGYPYVAESMVAADEKSHGTV